MLTRVDLRGTTTDPRDVLPRAQLDVAAAIEQIRPTVEAVHQHGASAVLAATERFDRVRPRRLRVPVEAIAAAAGTLDDAVRAALQTSIDRARAVHADQRRTDVTTQVVPGGTVTERWVPVSRVGLYVPGGLAPLLSSVVMNVVPAQLAGVTSIALASPPQRDTGLPHPGILAACALLGVDEVYAMGGAQAIAAFAYGLRAETAADPDDPGAGAASGWLLEPVDLVTGPGNIFVTAAKRMLRGVVGIDSEAGTTEIAILADDTADPVHVAADLISQAEHDPAAASVLVTASESLLAAVEEQLAVQVPATRHHERVATALSGKQSGVVLVDDLDHGLRVVDAYAAEHLEIQTADAARVAARVRNAGAVFVGAYSPVSLGDYAAGSNHVLPTGGCARHSSGLSVQTFLRGIHVIDYSQQALREVAPHVVALSAAEDLPAHGQAVTARFGGAG
ncbi:histidinol dehydrogenase [Actinocatenispora comari]|uniref:Histidinol dehydrogenase n=1 Tax=Actinocatenispora comari TaxID=2807577 RepID=A0A8J4EJ88_9ACTN|nr:histidinol dehydrogenase [Actinocatenispora comari]GIL26046.1 histidinol dehydrogenase [Actinocatenispora comari]